jgi:hypothetical protein
MGTSLSIYKKKTQFGMNNLPESLAKLGTNSKQKLDTTKDEGNQLSKVEPEPEFKAEQESKVEPELELETIRMVPNPEKSTINQNNQKLLMYDEQHLEEDEMSNTEKKVNEFNMVPNPEKSTINKNNQQLLHFDTEDQSNILQEMSINKNSTLNSGNKNLLLY